MKHRATNVVVTSLTLEQQEQVEVPLDQPVVRVEVSAMFVDDDSMPHGGVTHSFDSRQLPLAAREKLQEFVGLLEGHLLSLHFTGEVPDGEPASTRKPRGIAERFDNSAEPFDQGG